MKLIMTCLFAIMLSGCSTNFSEVKQVDDKAFLQLTGNFENGFLIIDGKGIDLTQVDTFTLDGQNVAKFEVQTGTHLIEILKKDKTVVKRKIYVTNGNVFEVIIP
ncbi:MAG: hypothetical protein ACI8R9_001584 [Paraglaciecola sp.]|jgi:hypothetical protein